MFHPLRGILSPPSGGNTLFPAPLQKRPLEFFFRNHSSAAITLAIFSSIVKPFSFHTGLFVLFGEQEEEEEEVFTDDSVPKISARGGHVLPSVSNKIFLRAAQLKFTSPRRRNRARAGKSKRSFAARQQHRRPILFSSVESLVV